MNIKNIIYATLLSLSSVSCVTDDYPENTGVVVGDMLPYFSVTLCNGEQIDTESLKGKIGVILFFNTSCQDCRDELPVIEEFYKTWSHTPDIVTLAISRGEDAESIEKYWTSNDLSIPWSAQKDYAVYNLFASVGIPRLYITDRTATIVASYGDKDIPSEATLNAQIESLL